jgi:hypothetical protein
MTGNGNGQLHGGGPIDSEHEDAMLGIATAIDRIFNDDPDNREIGFCIMVFRVGDLRNCNYVSNGNRDAVISLLREQLKLFEDNIQ